MAQLFEENYPAIRAFLGRRVGADLADDLTDDVFELALRKWTTFNPSRGTPRGWLFGLAHNKVREHRRAERRRFQALQRLPEDVLLGDETEGADERLDAKRQAARLALLIEQLPRGQRDVLLLHAWGSLSDVEIAEAIGVRPGTVRSRLSRARARVMEQLDADRPNTDEIPSPDEGDTSHDTGRPSRGARGRRLNPHNRT